MAHTPLWVLAFLVAISIVRKCVCPARDERVCIKPQAWAYTLLVVVAILSSGLLAGTVLLWIEFDTYQAFVGRPTIISGGGLSLVLLLFAALMFYSMCKRITCLLRLGFWLLLLLTLVEILFSLLVIYWIYELGMVPSDTLDSLFGSTREHIDDFLSTILDQPVAVAEGIVCMTYQTCCWSPLLSLMQHDASSGPITQGFDGGTEIGSGLDTTLPPPTSNRTTCLAPAVHSGAATDLELTMVDPSTSNFCPYTSGANAELLVAPPIGTCLLLETLANGAFSLDDCQANFCETGTEGYLQFVQMFVELLQRYGWPIAAGFATLVIVQLILAFNLRTSARLARAKKFDKGHAVYVENSFRAKHSESV